MSNGPIIVWFRRDLRVADNPALRYGFGKGTPVVPVYVDGWERGDRWAPGRAGRWWLDRSLERLSSSLASLGAPLLTLEGRAEDEIPRLCRETGAREVVWNRLYEPYSREVEERLEAALDRQGIGRQVFNATLLFEPEGLLTGTGRPFVQFTPFWRRCRSLPEPAPPEPGPARLVGTDDSARAETRGYPGRSAERLLSDEGEWGPTTGAADWEPGEAGALARLGRFLESGLVGYPSSRDFPGADATSRLSPHLHFGEIGPREVWRAILDATRAGHRDNSRSGVDGRPRSGSEASTVSAADAFLRQLGWREFGHYLLFHFPHIAEEPFRPEFARFPWHEDPEGLEAWKWGDTGYPLVDASMHQLLAEGWIHNRPRMVTASFLTKDLLIPWQDGAAWFWDRLVDADLANNTLGWQWTAGSGPDAAPYFRVFNPILQARRYDPDGTYVRAWEGERAADVAKGGTRDVIVEHQEARARALAAFRGMRKGSADRPMTV